MFILRILSAVLLFYMVQKPLYAQTDKWTQYGVRPLSMGNAFVAVADDFNALFYNPAGLARQKDWDIELLSLYAEASSAGLTFLQDGFSLAQNTSDNTEQVKKILDVVREQAGEVQHYALGTSPFFVMKNFGLAIGTELGGTLQFHAYPSIDVKLGLRIIAPIAVAFNLLENRLAIGFGLKLRAAGGVNHEFSIQDLERLEDAEGDTETLGDFIEAGQGFGADVGLLFTPIRTMEPTLGISIMDIGGTPYEKQTVGSFEPRDSPDSEPPKLNIGMSLKPWESSGMYLLTAVDVHQANLPISFSKKLNLGLEFGFGRFIKLQTGLHQGYLGGGFQFDIGFLALRAATYAEELGDIAGTKESRRYIIQLKLLI